MSIAYLSRMGLPTVTSEMMPPVAPAAKKKNMPPRSLGCNSFAVATNVCPQKTRTSNLLAVGEIKNRKKMEKKRE